MNELSVRMLARLLEARTGQQLNMNRSWRIETALQPLLRRRGISSVDQLITTLVARREPCLSDQVVDALLNNETFFFRDRTSFDLLLKGVLPRLQRARAKDKKLSIWCAGCSTGQEAYSIAMAVTEEERSWRGWKIDILATDVSGWAIDRAREGRFSQFEVQRGLGILQTMRWFQEEGGQQWRISRQLRDAVRFKVHNLADAAPQGGPFDAILCRNVLLYFAPPTRSAVFARLAEASAPDATLMLGAGETILGNTNAFQPDPEHRGLYLRVHDASARKPASADGCSFRDLTRDPF